VVADGGNNEPATVAAPANSNLKLNFMANNSAGKGDTEIN
jgi:hypothetical protein